jgi:hypothetical protein
MADGFSIPGWFHILRMAHVQIDVANLRSALADNHDLPRGLVEEERLDQRMRATPSAFRPNPLSTITAHHIPTNSMWWSAGSWPPIARRWTFRSLSRIRAPLRRRGWRYSAGAASKTHRSRPLCAPRTALISSERAWCRCPRPRNRIFDFLQMQCPFRLKPAGT